MSVVNIRITTTGSLSSNFGSVFWSQIHPNNLLTLFQLGFQLRIAEMSMLDLHVHNMFDFDVYRSTNSADKHSNKYEPEKFQCYRFQNNRKYYMTEIIVEIFQHSFYYIVILIFES